MKAIKKIYFTSILITVISIASVNYCRKHDGGDENASCTCSTEL